MKLRLIRHATLQLEMAGVRLLVDPMLANPGKYPSLTWGASAARNPTVPLPCDLESLLAPDMIVVTHRHFDHFDTVARERLPKRTPLVCQPAAGARGRGARASGQSLPFDAARTG